MEILKDRPAGPEDFGGCKEVQQWPGEEHGVELCHSTVYGTVRYDLGAELGLFSRGLQKGHTDIQEAASGGLPRQLGPLYRSTSDRDGC